MAIEGLTLIAEKINASIPSTQKVLEAKDLGGIQEIARMQDEGGADYIDVNVGRFGGEFMAMAVKAVQEVTEKPLSIDTPDPEIARAGLEAYDAAKANGALPILNSVSLLRLEMLEMYAVQPFKPLLMISEREEEGGSKPNHTAEEIHATATRIMKEVRSCGHPIGNDDCIFDPGCPSLGGDTEGMTRTLLGALERIQSNPDLAGTHVSVGLSNFTNMLPSRKKDGSPVRSPLESALLTKAMPLGLDHVIGSVKRKYRLLEPGDPALQCLEDALQLDGFDVVQRVMEFYS